MKALLKADEQSVLEIGKNYLVAHVHVTYKGDSYYKGYNGNVPVIPIWHNDSKAFTFAPKIDHYHIDGRFVANSSKVGRHYRVFDGFTASLITQVNDFFLSEVFYIKKKCLRLESGVGVGPVQLREWRQSMSGKSCKGRRCPHWGAMMCETGGQLVCPMHGLVGDIKTERIV